MTRWILTLAIGAVSCQSYANGRLRMEAIFAQEQSGLDLGKVASGVNFCGSNLLEPRFGWNETNVTIVSCQSVKEKK